MTTELLPSGSSLSLSLSVYRSGFSLSLSPDRPVAAEPVSVLDISGLAVLQESPKRATAPRHVLKRPPASGDFITVTDCMGNRVYLRKTQEQDEQVVTDTEQHTNTGNKNNSPENHLCFRQMYKTSY